MPGGVLLGQGGAEDLQLACWPHPPTWGCPHPEHLGRARLAGSPPSHPSVNPSAWFLKAKPLAENMTPTALSKQRRTPRPPSGRPCHRARIGQSLAPLLPPGHRLTLCLQGPWQSHQEGLARAAALSRPHPRRSPNPCQRLHLGLLSLPISSLCSGPGRASVLRDQPGDGACSCLHRGVLERTHMFS